MLEGTQPLTPIDLVSKLNVGAIKVRFSMYALFLDFIIMQFEMIPGN